MFFKASNFSAYFHISPIVFIVCGSILLIFASKISQYIVTFSEADEGGRHITVSEQTTRIALLVLGIFVLAEALPQLTQICFDVGLYYINFNEIPEHLRSTQPRWVYLVGPLMKFIIGVILILGPDKIIGILSKYDETVKRLRSYNMGVEKDEQ